MLESAESEWCWNGQRVSGVGMGLRASDVGIGRERVVLEWAESEWCWNGQRASGVGMGRERVVLECVESE